MNRRRIFTRCQRIGASAAAYLAMHSELRRRVRDKCYAGIKFRDELYPYMLGRVASECAHWMGDRFSPAAPVAHRAALHAVCYGTADSAIVNAVHPGPVC